MIQSDARATRVIGNFDVLILMRLLDPDVVHVTACRMFYF